MENKPTTFNLYLLRHGKAVKNSVNDFDRMLTCKGQRQAEEKGELIKKIANSLDLILCSPSHRTRETLSYLNIESFKPEVRFDEELYLATSDNLMQLIHNSKKKNSLLIIGHNPALHQLADILFSSCPSFTDNHLNLESFPAGALAHFCLNNGTKYEFKMLKSKLVAFYT